MKPLKADFVFKVADLFPYATSQEPACKKGGRKRRANLCEFWAFKVQVHGNTSLQVCVFSQVSELSLFHSNSETKNPFPTPPALPPKAWPLLPQA